MYDNPLDISLMQRDTTIQTPIRDGLGNFYNDYQLNAQGQPIIQYTYGIALMNLPFFGAVHFYDLLSGSQANGFEARYQMAIKLAGIFYLILGLWFVYGLLKVLIDKYFARIGVALLLVGTNLFWFSFSQAGMAHVNLFCLYALLIYLSHQYFSIEGHKKRIELGIFFVLALIILIRPTDFIAILVPLLYGVSSMEELKSRLHLVRQNFVRYFIFFLTIGLIVFAPQCWYWYEMSGHIFYYSYGNQGFNWLSPRIIEGLFGAKNGWFTYTPLMLLASVALIIQKKNNLIWLLSLILLPLYIYITYSWWCYNYINGFGSRPMIHLYALLIIPLMFLLSKVNRLGKLVMSVFLTMACFVNLSFTSKMENGSLFSDESNHRYNWNILFKRYIDVSDLAVLDLDMEQPNDEDLKTFKVIETISFDSLATGFYQSTSSEEFPPCKIEAVVNPDFLEASYFKFSGEFLAKDHVFMIYDQHQFVMSVHRAGEQIDWRSIKINNKIGKKRLGEKVEIRTTNIEIWDEVSFYYPVSKLKVGDKITLLVWNAGKKDLNIKKIALSLVK
jgi:hypothetical protein